MAKGNCPVTIARMRSCAAPKSSTLETICTGGKDLADDTEPSGPGAPFARITAISMARAEKLAALRPSREITQVAAGVG